MKYLKIDFNKVERWQKRRLSSSPPWPSDFAPLGVKPREAFDYRCDGWMMAPMPLSHPRNPQKLVYPVYTWAIDNVSGNDERWCILQVIGDYDQMKEIMAWFGEEAVEELDSYQFIQACDAANMVYTDG